MPHNLATTIGTQCRMIQLQQLEHSATRFSDDNRNTVPHDSVTTIEPQCHTIQRRQSQHSAAQVSDDNQNILPHDSAMTIGTETVTRLTRRSICKEARPAYLSITLFSTAFCPEVDPGTYHGLKMPAHI